MNQESVEAINRVADKLITWRDYAIKMAQDTDKGNYRNEANGYQLLIADLDLALRLDGHLEGIS